MSKHNLQNSVFGVINLSDSEDYQKNVARYAGQLARSLGLRLVLYPHHTSNDSVFKFRTVINVAKKIPGISVSVSRLKINIFSFFTSLHDIASQEQAAFIVMGVGKHTAGSFGSTIWSMTQKTMIPTILIPRDIVFKPYAHIALAIDDERKLQKIEVVRTLAQAFGSTIKIFQQNHEDAEHAYLIQNGMQHIVNYLNTYAIGFSITKARKTTNFPKNLCKFSSKNADLLVIEVDPGKIDKVIKQNIETLLRIDAYAQPVLFTKTKMVGRYENFNQ